MEKVISIGNQGFEDIRKSREPSKSDITETKNLLIDFGYYDKKKEDIPSFKTIAQLHTWRRQMISAKTHQPEVKKR